MTDTPPPKPQPDRLKQAGLVAAVLLLPGGFILGATLIARARRKKRP